MTKVTVCHCEESRSGGTTKQSSRFDKLKAPSRSRGWIATPGDAGLAMTRQSVSLSKATPVIMTSAGLVSPPSAAIIDPLV